MKKVNEKLRKRDRALNAVKSGAKRARKFCQKIQPLSNKLKPIINPRSALFGLILISILKPTISLAAIELPGDLPLPRDSYGDLPGWKGNLSMVIIIAGAVEETTYRTSSMVPGSSWFNSRIAAPIAAVGSYACHSFGWHNKGWTCTGGAASCTGYVIGAHRAAPNDPILTASRTATSPFEAAKEYFRVEEGLG
tara:strand:- start:1958 stop:2539 length:582 start_codon:yes stop_codon:yes gene_type:complete